MSAGADPRDDFSAFAGNEHMFFGLREPLRLIREELERSLRKQVPETRVEAIRTRGTPKFLTLGKGEPKMIVTWFGFSVQAQLVVHDGARAHQLPSTLTFLFGRVNEPGRELSRLDVDLAADADRTFTDECFQRRFLEFRASEG